MELNYSSCHYVVLRIERRTLYMLATSVVPLFISAAQAALELVVVLLPPLCYHWDFRHVPPSLTR